ncbi:aminotransferase class I/II-fold pyridoxal phosphate-dependent enzyme [Atlantibacter sp.]|uniref:aminotransferase class I/II-fold pyridoxal phosphate-dependent enzyme n=1 Tax=Atlantibacter sp. TaxID=1903473 RepID=UPI003917D181
MQPVPAVDQRNGEFHYTRKVLPALKSLDSQDRVIYVGTFSKTVMPAVRISYIVMPKAAIARFREIGEIMEAGQPVLTQKILAAFLAEGHFYKHFKKMRALYQQQRKMLLEALQTVYPGLFEVALSDGGMHIVAFLRTSTRDIELAALWQRHQLQVSALAGWYCLSAKRYGLVMSYTNIASIGQGIMLISRPRTETLALLT